MKFVKNYHVNAGQFGVRLYHPRQDAFSDHLDAGFGAAFDRAAHTVADTFPGDLAQCFGHAFGGGARRQAAWLQHQDPPCAQVCLQQRQRHTGGFASPRWGLKNSAFAVMQRINKRRQRLLDW